MNNTFKAYAIVSKKSGNIVKDDPFRPTMVIFPSFEDAKFFREYDTKREGRERFDVEEITITRNNG